MRHGASFAQAPNQLRNAVKQGLRGSYDQLLKGVLRMVVKASEGDAAGGRVYAFAADPPKKKARRKKGGRRGSNTGAWWSGRAKRSGHRMRISYTW